MLKQHKAALLLLVPLLAAFGWGLIALFNLRFAAGDAQPEYSSLRADPLGTKALYESLKPLLPVRRNLQPLLKIPDDQPATLLFAGVEADDLDLPWADFKHLESFLQHGGRVVITLYPSYTGISSTNLKAVMRGQPVSPQRQGKDTKDDPFLKNFETAQFEKEWGFGVIHDALKKTPGGGWQAVNVTSTDTNRNPASLSWHSALCFSGLDPAWRVIYQRRDQPVLIERKRGAGSIVLATDSYFLSNEAMRNERHAALLAWVVGRSPRVIFDETHLGIAEDPGIAALARKYRLHGLLAGLLLLGALFIWKNAAAFGPPRAADTDGDHVLGKDSVSGFVNLLRRGIAPAALLPLCVEEWKKSRHLDRQHSAERLARADAALAANYQRNPVEAYRTVSRILNEKHQPRKTGEVPK
ncbi:MAG: DUF4350 domain-containing protein [Pedosphaera sp.]|nr:DUF4350 domain-containing protein [Pedosphaera sp.]